MLQECEKGKVIFPVAVYVTFAFLSILHRPYRKYNNIFFRVRIRPYTPINELCSFDNLMQNVIRFVYTFMPLGSGILCDRPI